METIHGVPPMSTLKKFDVRKYSSFKEIEHLFNVKKEDYKDFEDYFADLMDNGFKLLSKETCFLTRHQEVVNRGSLDNEQVVKFVFGYPTKYALYSRMDGKFINFKNIDEQKKIFPILNKINNVLNSIGKEIYYNTPNDLIIIVKNI